MSSCCCSSTTVTTGISCLLLCSLICLRLYCFVFLQLLSSQHLLFQLLTKYSLLSCLHLSTCLQEEELNSNLSCCLLFVRFCISCPFPFLYFSTVNIIQNFEIQNLLSSFTKLYPCFWFTKTAINIAQCAKARDMQQTISLTADSQSAVDYKWMIFLGYWNIKCLNRYPCQANISSHLACPGSGKLAIGKLCLCWPLYVFIW